MLEVSRDDDTNLISIGINLKRKKSLHMPIYIRINSFCSDFLYLYTVAFEKEKR